MEQPAANSPQVRGKDLVGGIKVMPMGLGDHIKKRTSGEFKSEQRGGNLQFSNADKSSSHAVKESKQLTSFMEESSYQGGFQPASSLKTSSQKQASFMQSSAQKTSAMSSSKEFMSSNQMASSQIGSSQMASSQMASSQMASSQMASSQMASSQMASSQMASSQMSSSSRSFSKTLSSSESKTTSMKSSEMAQKELHSDMPSQQFGLEIGQNELKTQIESAITDLEQDRDFVDYDKNNQPIKLTSPPQTFSPPPSYASQPKQASLDMFSPPPLEPMDPPEVMVTPHLLDQAPPTRNLIQNGFSEFSSSSSKTTTEVQEMSQVTESSIQLAQVMNGGLRQEDSSSIQGSSSSSSLLQKIMTPATVEYDTGSLKRRDPRKMFTDSSFYSAKHHPTVADQVEMAHKLSSAMFSKENKTAKGQQMFLNRAQNAGEDIVDDGPRHDTVPNLKLVMNPEGKIHEWGDMPADQLPDAAQLASHAAPNCPNLNSPDINPVAEDLIGGVGKGGELFAKRRKRAENWIVDEASVGQKKPSAFADKFVQEQTQHQQIFQEQKQLEEHQRQQVVHQQSEQQRQQQMQQQQQSQQQFAAQQQFKQEQSLELRRQQEEQTMMAEQELELPANFKHTDLKARGCATPSLDLSCHNVQGINVWANTAPRGWGSMKRTTVTQKPAPPTLSVCPATPSVDQEQLQKQMEQARIQEEFEQHEREEQMYLEQQQLKMEQQTLEFEHQEQNRIQQEQEQIRIHQEQAQMRIQQEQEQMRIQHEQEQIRIQHEQEQMRIQQQQEQMRIQQQQEQIRIQQQQEQMRIQQQQEQLRIQQEEEERFRIQQEQQELRIKQEQEEMIRIQQQQEQLRIQQEQEEQLRIQQEQLRIQQAQEEQLRIQQEQMRIQHEQEEQLRIQQDQLRIQQEQLRIQQEQEEQLRVQQEQLRIQQEQELIAQQNAEAARKWEEAEAMRAKQEKEQQMIIQKQQEEEMRMLQLQQEQMRMQQEQARQEEAERQRQESLRLEDQRQAEMKQQQEQLLVTQQQTFTQQTSSIKSGASHSEQDLEARKREEYEEWFRTQEKEALEYSACVKYQETASERHNVSTEMRTATSASNSMMKQQHIVQNTGEQRSNLQQHSQLSMSKGVQQQQKQVVLPLLETGAQLAQPPMTLPSFESSNMSSFQQHSSTQQSLSQTSTKQSMEIYESQRVGYGGVTMEHGQDQDKTFLRDSGVFGGISGDSNDLVGTDVDYKRHSVKDLAKHYALVKPKAEIPINVLPEIKLYNGQQGPALNYLGDSSQGETRQTYVKKEVSQDEIDASKHAYEMKKKQQMEQHQQKKIEQTSQTTSSVAMRQQTSSTETKSQAVTSERRQSLTTALLMDPAQQHSQAGIIDPSAILRGEQLTTFSMSATPFSSNPSHTKINLRDVSSSPSSKMYLSHNTRQGPKPFGSVQANTLPRSFKPPAQFVKTSIHESQDLLTTNKMSVPKTEETSAQLSNLPSYPSQLDGISLTQQQNENITNKASVSVIASDNTVHNSPSPKIQPMSLEIPEPSKESSEYLATVQTSSKQFLPSTIPKTLPIPSISVDQPSPEPSTTPSCDMTHVTQSTTQYKHTQHNHPTVIQTMLKNTAGAEVEMDINLSTASTTLPPVSRSSMSTPAPTTPFPRGLGDPTIRPSSVILNRPYTPILYTTRPSSVLGIGSTIQERSRHVSKDDMARMIAELNAPLPPMEQIPQEIRASPLIFSGGQAAVSHVSSSSFSTSFSSSSHPPPSPRQ